MKIVVKQTDILKATWWEGVTVEQYMVYLMDTNGRPLTCEIVYGKAAKNDLLNEILLEHFIPKDWENNKNTFDVSNIVEEVTYEDFIKLAETEEV